MDEAQDSPFDANADFASAPPSLLAHVVDAHCHPTDSGLEHDVFARMAHRVCAMATRTADQALVADLARTWPDKVIPCFGFHPWFTHMISLAPAEDTPTREEHYEQLLAPATEEQREAYDALLSHLPKPTPLSEILDAVRARFLEFPTAMLGEVGIDRGFRIAHSYSANPRLLSPFTPPTEHQLAILEAQLDLAVELKRNVSLHSVKAQQVTVDLLKRMKAKHGERWFAISVDLHSCGLRPETWQQIQKTHSNVFFSLSMVINSRSPNHRALIAATDPHRLLVESDYHTATESGPRTWEMLHTIAEVRCWDLEREWTYHEEATTPGVHETSWGVIRRLEENWKRFERGNHFTEGRKKKSSKQRKKVDAYESGDEY